MTETNQELLKVYFDWRGLADYLALGYGDARLEPNELNHKDKSMRYNIELFVPLSVVDLEYYGPINRTERSEFIRLDKSKRR